MTKKNNIEIGLGVVGILGLTSLGGCIRGSEVYRNKEYDMEKEPISSPLPLPVEEESSLFVFDNAVSQDTELIQQEEEALKNIEEIIGEEEVVYLDIVTENDEVELEYNEEVERIFELIPDLFFDVNGNLFFGNNVEEDPSSLLVIETKRHLTYPYEPVEEVKFFVIHYDGGPLLLNSGQYRTVFNTLNGLNRKGKPSVQFCVDPYPVNNEIENEGGLGVILSQKPNEIPYKGRHVQIGIDLTTGREDINRIKTAKLYKKIGIGSDFIRFVNTGEKDFDAFSLGVEQIGTNFSINFPEQFPPRQQIANMVALSRAVSQRYGLSIWDIVGHGEIQEKSDPGDEYMLTLRYLLGVAYMLDESEFPENFLETENPYEYFVKLREYGIMKMGKERYMRWNEVYGMEEEEPIEDIGIEYYNEGPSELATYEAILAAVKEFAGKPYSWNAEQHHCSGYVAQYLKYLGFPIGLVTDPVSTYTPERGDLMPNATTVKQVKYLRMISENYGKDLVSEITLKEMLSNEEIWEEIPAGTVLYLPERIGHHGYDTFTHTAIFMGLDSNQEPMFSEFSVYMKNGPEYGHGFEQFTRMYRGQNIEPYNSKNGELKVFLFDAVEASKRIRLEAESIGEGIFQGGEIIR